jgi:hypothetical protein
MFFLTRGLPLLLEVGFTIYCLVDAVQTPTDQVRNLPKWAWIVLILIFPLAGGATWLLAGRPGRDAAGGPPQRGGAPAPPPMGPDDDPEFLRQIQEVDAEHERTLRQWEADLRRREQDLRGDIRPEDQDRDGGS